MRMLGQCWIASGLCRMLRPAIPRYAWPVPPDDSIYS